MTFDEIREKGLLLFEYVRGSKLYHTDTPDSDEDHGGVFIAPPDFGFNIDQEIADEKNDTKWWEIGKFMKLALTSNPSVIEAFFVPDELVIYEHPLFAELRKHRNEFITKECFKPFGSYAVSQIKKSRGQNKKINWEINDMKRKTPLDFCHTYNGKQGSVPITKYLEKNGLRQDCCGLVDLPNMKDNYLLYYDFAQHLKLSGRSFMEEYLMDTTFFKFVESHFRRQIKERSDMFIQGEIEECPEEYYITSENDIFDYIEEKTETPYGEHCGIINQDGTSNTIRLCSTNKDETPLCVVNYNHDGYGTHCRKYKEYMEWKTKRNKARYESNLEGEKSGNPDMMYDCKNMYHSFRNVAMCIEIAKGEGLKLDRTGIDRDFLLDVRNRKYGFSELYKKLEEMTIEMENACAESTISDHIDEATVIEMTKELRREFYTRDYMSLFKK